MLKTVRAGVLDVAYFESGSEEGWPVFLMHGFPYDAHAYEAATEPLVAAGARVIVPFLRGYGPTRFLAEDTPRSGQQAALAEDLRGLMDALGIPNALLAGHDWGGRAACIVAALWPERVRALVSVNSYNIQDIAVAMRPSVPENEMRHWYQYYFHSERGRAGLAANRHAFCKLLWRLWSPKWAFDDATYDQTATSFENPDFVDVVIHSYRHRFALVAGDPAVEDIEVKLTAQPPITVPTITLDGDADGVMAVGGTAGHAEQFTGRHEHRIIPDAGHNPAQETPGAFADAVLTAKAWSDEG